MKKNILQKIFTFVFILILSACSEGGNVKINDSSTEGVPVAEAPTALERATLTSDELLRIAISSLITISTDGSQSAPLSMTQATISSATVINLVGCVQVGELYYDFTGSTTGAVSSIEFDTFTEATSCDADTVNIDDTIEVESSVTGTVGGSCSFRQFSAGLSMDCDEYQDDSTLGSYVGAYNIFALTETAYSVASSGTFSYEDTFGVSSLEILLKGTITFAEDDIACFQATSLTSLAEDFSSDTCDGENTYNYNQVIGALSEGSEQAQLCVLSYALCAKSNSTCFSAEDAQEGISICTGGGGDDTEVNEIQSVLAVGDIDLPNSLDSVALIGGMGATYDDLSISIYFLTDQDYYTDIQSDALVLDVRFLPYEGGFSNPFSIGISNAGLGPTIISSFDDNLGLRISLNQRTIQDSLILNDISSGTILGNLFVYIQDVNTNETLVQSENLWKISFQFE